MTELNIKEKLVYKLNEIDEVIRQNLNDEVNIGVLDGLSGISLFQFYYSNHFNKEENYDFGVEILYSCIKIVNKGYNLPGFCYGLSGFGWAIDHLEKEGIIKIEVDNILQQFDDYLYQEMILKLNKQIYDFLNGGIGIALYFITRYTNTKSEELKSKYRSILIKFIDQLKKISIQENDIFKWKKDDVYDLGLSHGISSIIAILTKLYNYPDFEEKVRPMLLGSIKYISLFENKDCNSICHFPNLINEKESNDYKSRLAWCYGDLGIGITFWNAAKALDDENLKKLSLKVLKKCASRRTFLETTVYDAPICHGSFGNALIFSRLFKETKNLKFKEASNYWIKDGLDKSNRKDGFAGISIRDNSTGQPWKKSLGLIQGVSGIGLIILDYLSNYDSNWEECLLIK